MIKISPFTPLFFSPSSDKFGADSKYVQLFSPEDNILIQVLTTTEYKMDGRLKNHVDGSIQDIEFQSFSLKDDTTVFYSTITGLAPGYYSVTVGEQECDVFKVTNDEKELSKTTLIRYSMRSNKQRNDCVFWNGEDQFYFEFRAPGGFKDDDWTFAVNNEQFEISNGNIVELFAIESTQKKFTLGNAEGCPVWFAEHLNRILCCSNVYFNGVRFVRKGNSVPEMTQEIVSLKSYIFKVSLQGMVDNIDVDFPEGGEEEGGETGGGGEGYVYLIKLNDTVVPTDRNTFSALRILAEIDKAIKTNNEGLVDKFISKKNDDYAEGIITFLKDIIVKGPIKALSKLTVGESIIDSLIAGKGIIAEDGRIQADRMELRSSLTVLELIFNRLSAMESDYSFSESGTIESVELLEDGTYRLPLRKRWENDFTALDENDVVYGVVNNLASGTGDSYTSWLRVLNVNTVANTITALMFPDDEVPGGKNYPPEPLMILSHRGNPVNEDRQAYWYLSSREKCICMLDGVTKPILEENNYAIIIGKLKQLSLFDNLPINYRHSYIYCRGIAIQDLLRLGYQGTPVRSENNRGPWSAEDAVSNPYQSTPEVFDAVYHIGCKWMCLVTGTTQEPKWNATDWAQIEGNSELSLVFSSNNGYTFFAGKVDAEFTPIVYWGYNDISEDVLPGDWSWTRDSGQVTEDNAWSIAHANNGRILHLTNEDMPNNWGATRKVKFTCTAYVRDGAGSINVENYIDI
nr:MAG TPA: tail protein [Caudoviricetes sp.]